MQTLVTNSTVGLHFNANWRTIILFVLYAVNIYFLFSDAFNILQILDATAMGTISIATIVLASKAVCCQSSTVQGTNLIHQQGEAMSAFYEHA